MVREQGDTERRWLKWLERGIEAATRVEAGCRKGNGKGDERNGLYQ